MDCNERDCLLLIHRAVCNAVLSVPSWPNFEALYISQSVSLSRQLMKSNPASSLIGLSHSRPKDPALVTPGPGTDKQGQPFSPTAHWSYSHWATRSLLTHSFWWEPQEGHFPIVVPTSDPWPGPFWCDMYSLSWENKLLFFFSVLLRYHWQIKIAYI